MNEIKKADFDPFGQYKGDITGQLIYDQQKQKLKTETIPKEDMTEKWGRYVMLGAPFFCSLPVILSGINVSQKELNFLGSIF